VKRRRGREAAFPVGAIGFWPDMGWASVSLWSRAFAVSEIAFVRNPITAPGMTSARWVWSPEETE
jgi:hypothetical protein